MTAAGNLRIKDTAATFVLYYDNTEEDHLIGSFPKTQLGLFALVSAFNAAREFFKIPDIKLDLGEHDCIMLQAFLLGMPVLDKDTLRPAIRAYMREF